MKTMYQLLDELRISTEEEALEKGVILKLSNGAEISVLHNGVFPETGTSWPWKIDTQFFSDEQLAAQYLLRRINEKMTGKRVLLFRHRIPDICGINGSACRHPNKCNTALCTDCPVKEQFHAEQDGLELVYAFEGEVLA